MVLENPTVESMSESLASATATSNGLVATLKAHWPEYLMESFGLGLFMVSACLFTILLYHPSSELARSISSEPLRRLLMGGAMGSTAIAIIFSPFGKRSGAHINPAVTLTYFRLGRIATWDAVFYTLFQFGGGIVGVLLTSFFLADLLSHSTVNYAVTIPGPLGLVPAFGGELLISFLLMLVILTVSNSKSLGRWTGFFAGALIASYITLESPLSGMSMNPARTVASAVGAQLWTALWIYFLAPAIGMLTAAELFTRVRSAAAVACAKLHHHNNQRCIFRCNFQG